MILGSRGVAWPLGSQNTVHENASTLRMHIVAWACSLRPKVDGNDSNHSVGGEPSYVAPYTKATHPGPNVLGAHVSSSGGHAPNSHIL